MENQSQIVEEKTQGVVLKDWIYMCLNRWYWFLISVIIMLAGATFYILKTAPIYQRTAKILVKADKKGSSAIDVSDFTDVGFMASNVNVQNELITIQSMDNKMETVRRLNLDVNYTHDGLFRPTTLYEESLPVKVSFLDLTDDQSAALVLKPDKNQVELSDFVFNGESVSKKMTVKLGDTVSTPVGRIVVSKTDYYKNNSWPKINVTRSTMNAACRTLSSKITVAQVNKGADVLSISVSDVIKKRADDIINMLVAVYNGNWLKDKNQITISTSQFINDRLQVIEGDLGNVDDDISSYKSANLLPDVGAVSSMYLGQNREVAKNIVDLENRMNITRYIRNYLASEASHDQLLPVNSGVDNTGIEAQISRYNEMMMRRNSLVANSSTQNPLVLELDEKLAALRSSVIASLDNQITTLNKLIQSAVSTEKNVNAHIAAGPTQAKYLLSVERQQKVKESLYLYLLQKREENELSQAFTAYNNRVIEHPNGGSAPIKPKKSIIILAALLIGLAIPVVIIFLNEQMNTSLRGRDDLKNVKMPFIAEIPLTGEAAAKNNQRKSLMFRGLFGKKKDDLETNTKLAEIVVKAGSRSTINEAFRVMRTNVEFMCKEGTSHVMMFTSYNPGSGKSFITMNFAMSLAIKDKRVLVVDGDMRHCSMSQFVNGPKIGMSNYLAGKIDDVRSTLVPINEKHPNLKVLPVGTIPPNPTELLATDRFSDMIKDLSKDFDYVFIDCPPIDIVADTQIISGLADYTIFIVRAGNLERSMLPELDKLYESHRYNNMCMVLNGTYSHEGRYGYKYGYRYGYRYGNRYGYSYGSYYHDEDDGKSTSAKA